jgi:hypothetical protein
MFEFNATAQAVVELSRAELLLRFLEFRPDRSGRPLDG